MKHLQDKYIELKSYSISLENISPSFVAVFWINGAGWF